MSIVSLFLGFYLLKVSFFYYLATLLLFIPFLLFVRAYQKLKSQIDTLEAYSYFIKQELARITINLKKIQSREPWEYPESVRNHPLSIDLDLCNKNGLFAYLDTTATKQGFSEFINVLLQNGTTFLEILTRQQKIKTLVSKKFQPFLLLKHLHTRVREPRAKWDAEISVKPILFWSSGFRKILRLIFPIFSILTPIYGILSLLFNLPLFTVILFVNLLLFLSYRKDSLKVWKQIATISKATNEFSRLILYVSSEKKETKKYLDRIQRLGDSFEILVSPLPHFLLNGILLWDLWKIQGFSKWVQNFGETWNQSWEKIREFDSLSPFVNLSILNPEYEFPNIAEGSKLQAKDLVHPLLSPEFAVHNPLEAVSKGDLIVITGSNMSGKTTYLRSVAVSLLLARAGARFAGRGLDLPPFQIHTLIRSQDSLEDGVSFFYSEVRRLAEILRSADSEKQIPILFLDEILKGTNSKERYIATRELLFALKEKGAIVFVTTHDLKLSEIPWAKQFHFTELELDGSMSFDYRIRSGVSKSTNALKILKKEGIPILNEEE